MSDLISITPHELKMLINGYHPEFETSDEQGSFVEKGKGSDIIFEKEAKRKSDGQIFKFSYIHNSELSWNHDSVYAGDFIVDESKEDTLDPYNELKDVACKSENKSKTLYDQYEAIKDTLTPFTLDNPIVNPEVLADIFDRFCAAVTDREFVNFSSEFLKLAVEMNIEPYSIRSVFLKHREKKSRTWLSNYRDLYNKINDINTKIVIRGIEYEFSQKEIESLKKQLSPKI